MAEGEKVDLVKAVTSVATPVYWVKTIMYGLGISCLLFVGYGVYGYYFKKKPATQNVVVQKGGQLDIHNEAQKRNFILFAEPFVQVDTRVEGQHGSIGIRAGCRWEF